MSKLVISATILVFVSLCGSGLAQAEEPLRVPSGEYFDCSAPGAKTDPRYALICGFSLDVTQAVAPTKVKRILLVDLGERELKVRQKLR